MSSLAPLGVTYERRFLHASMVDTRCTSCCAGSIRDIRSKVDGITRRSFLEISLAGMAALRCASFAELPSIPQHLVDLEARPASTGTETEIEPGIHKLNISDGRDGCYYVPRGRPEHVSSPLILLLHGAGGSGARILSRLMPHVETLGAIVLAPDSRAQTWDVMTRQFGTDPPFVARALEKIFRSFRIDPRRIAIAGFSDGATYALTLGLSNGDLFSKVAAFSPGYLVIGDRARGKPHVFISHGTRDDILPIDKCGRRAARQLTRAGYAVEFHEFDGGHALPPDQMLAAALAELVAS